MQRRKLKYQIFQFYILEIMMIVLAYNQNDAKKDIVGPSILVMISTINDSTILQLRNLTWVFFLTRFAGFTTLN